MDFWPSVPWEALVTYSNRPAKNRELKLPFALIGSHSACNIRINEAGAPPVAYIAFAFEDSIEAWPLCPIAYPQWGAISQGQSLRVGRTRVKLFSPNAIDGPSPVSHDDWDSSKSGIDSLGDRDPFPIVQFDSRAESYSFLLGRRVVILGNGHPSTFRLHGAKLFECDHAIVSIGDCCWFIDLRPGPKYSTLDLVKLIRVGEPSIKIRKLSFSCRLPKPEELTEHRRSSEAASLLKSTMPVKRPGRRRASIRSDEIPKSSPGLAKPVSATNPIADFSADNLTSDITDRLVSIDQSRWWQRRLVKAGLTGILFAAAIATLSWIAIEHLLPIVMDIQGR